MLGSKLLVLKDLIHYTRLDVLEIIIQLEIFLLSLLSFILSITAANRHRRLTRVNVCRLCLFAVMHCNYSLKFIGKLNSTLTLLPLIIPGFQSIFDSLNNLIASSSNRGCILLKIRNPSSDPSSITMN